MTEPTRWRTFAWDRALLLAGAFAFGMFMLGAWH